MLIYFLKKGFKGLSLYIIINLCKFVITGNEKYTCNIINKFNTYWMRIN